MQLKLASKEPDYAVQVSKTTGSYVNAIRRYAGFEVPTLAIEDVEIRKNDSALYDEILAHRLALIPITTDLKSYKLAEDGDESKKGSAEYELKLTLKEKGPKLVTAKDLKSADPKAKPVFDETPIVKLLEGQSLEFIGIARLGQGKTHMKWSPGLTWHEQRVKSLVVNDKHPDYEQYQKKFPEGAFKNTKLNTQAIIDADLVDAVAGIHPEIVKVEYDDDEFVLHIEPWGQLEPKDILKTAVEYFNADLDEFDKLAKALK